HLMRTEEELRRFAAKVGEVLRPQGLLCLGARNVHDCDPAEMALVGHRVYEYKRRPGHRIRYWDDEGFRQFVGQRFAIVALSGEMEPETVAKPAPCHLTVMIARKRTSQEFIREGHGATRRDLVLESGV